MRSRGQVGFTLIELMLTVGIASIIGSTFYITLLYQHSAYTRQLDNIEAQQNARAALGIVSHFVRQAGWGFAADQGLVGAPAVGSCFDEGSSPTFSFDCDNVDENEAVDSVAGTGELSQQAGVTRGGSDRLRIVFGTAAGFTEHAENTNFGDGLALGDATSPPPGHPLRGLAMVSGRCSDDSKGKWGNDYGADLIEISGPVSSYSMDLFDPAIARGCPPGPGGVGYGTGFGLGVAKVVDFFIDRSTPETPRLMMRDDPSADLDDPGSAHVVSYDIDDMQVQYGVDTDATPTVRADLWCDDVRPPSAGGKCESGLTLTETLARVVAVRIAIVPRTRLYRKNRDYQASLSSSVKQTEVFNHTIRRTGDGYMRWVYRTTIALRNRDLQ